MADRIKQYMTYVNEILENPQNRDWEEEMKKHLVQIAFFAHERFIHLLVTVLFALMTTMVFLYLLEHFSLVLVLLLVLLMGLLLPYIKHYFLLENSVQDMYEQYDKMQQKAGKSSFVREGTYKR